MKARRYIWLYRCIGILAVIAGAVIAIWLLVDYVNDERIANSGKVYVSSFVVDGTDYGNGYFKNEGSTWHPEYHFYNSESEEMVFFKIDRYVEDSSKVQGADIIDQFGKTFLLSAFLCCTPIGGLLVYKFLFKYQKEEYLKL